MENLLRMKSKEMLWMYGIFFMLIILSSVSATLIVVNATDNLGNNYTLNFDLPNQTIIYNYTNNYTIINQTVFYNITNVTCINCTNYYNNTNTGNLSSDNFYNRTQSDNIYVLKTDLQNWKTLELPSLYLKKTDINYSDMIDSVNKIKNNFTDFDSRLEDNSFTPMWKMIVVIAIIIGLLAIGISARAMMG